MSFFFFKQKTAYEMRISDWSSDVCSSDLRPRFSWSIISWTSSRTSASSSTTRVLPPPTLTASSSRRLPRTLIRRNRQQMTRADVSDSARPGGDRSVSTAIAQAVSTHRAMRIGPFGPWTVVPRHRTMLEHHQWWRQREGDQWAIIEAGAFAGNERGEGGWDSGTCSWGAEGKTEEI